MQDHALINSPFELIWKQVLLLFVTAGPNGPILLQDHYLIQKVAQFNRERVPESVVHAKGGGAHGFFEVTEDVTPCGDGTAVKGDNVAR